MSQNLLPFESHEMARYGVSYTLFRCLLLRYSQSRTFRNADGLVFLTNYAKNTVMRVTKKTKGGIAIIPHGVVDRFVCPPKKQLDIGQYSFDHPFRILYVSIVNVYKHQWHVAEAVARLRSSGLPVALDLAGPAYGPAFKRLLKVLGSLDPKGEFINYLGERPYDELHTIYAQSDLAVFASSCENLPIILLESMAAGLPIACSSRGPMPEVLGDAGEYFDPEKPSEIAHALGRLIADPELRARKSQGAFEKATKYSWIYCAEQTLGFLAETAGNKTYIREKKLHPSVQFHEDLANQWEEKYDKHTFNKRLGSLLSLVDGINLQSSKMLDAGCGTGTITRKIVDYGCSVVGVDASPAMIELAASLSHKDKNANLMSFQLIDTIAELPFEDNYFDGVICSSVLEYLDEPVKAIRELNRVLKPNGVCLLSVPNKTSWLRRAQSGCFSVTKYLKLKPYPTYLTYLQHQFYKQEILTIIEKNGFTVNKLIYGGLGLPGRLNRVPALETMIMLLATKR
jgi:ubiquinone/menaquinone biosynthesis C-methylase UbiE